jgi:hypothetical protein
MHGYLVAAPYNLITSSESPSSPGLLHDHQSRQLRTPKQATRRVERTAAITQRAIRPSIQTLSSTPLNVANVVEESKDRAREAGAPLGPVPRMAAKVAAPSRRSSPTGYKGGNPGLQGWASSVTRCGDGGCLTVYWDRRGQGAAGCGAGTQQRALCGGQR